MDDRDMEPTECNRAGWGPGPWDAEPDKLQWTTAAGYDALIVRNHMGALCGYVGVPKGHPAYERSWCFADSYERGADGDLDYDRPKPNPVNSLSAHGGITYAEHCQGNICHVPEPGRPDDVWWLGFDCSHAGDVVPRMRAYAALRQPFSAYRDIAYVHRAVESLAEQLKAMAP